MKISNFVTSLHFRSPLSPGWWRERGGYSWPRWWTASQTWPRPGTSSAPPCCCRWRRGALRGPTASSPTPSRGSTRAAAASRGRIWPPCGICSRTPPSPSPTCSPVSWWRVRERRRTATSWPTRRRWVVVFVKVEFSELIYLQSKVSRDSFFQNNEKEYNFAAFFSSFSFLIHLKMSPFCCISSWIWNVNSF